MRGRKETRRARARSILAAGAVILFAAGMAGLAQQNASSPRSNTASGNAQNGKKLFAADGCYQCHGYEGQGAAGTGAARIGPPQLPFQAFVDYVRHPSNQMPPYTAKVVSDQELADIFAYLSSIPKPPAGKEIPLLNE